MFHLPAHVGLHVTHRCDNAAIAFVAQSDSPVDSRMTGLIHVDCVYLRADSRGLPINGSDPVGHEDVSAWLRRCVSNRRLDSLTVRQSGASHLDWQAIAVPCFEARFTEHDVTAVLQRFISRCPLQPCRWQVRRLTREVARREKSCLSRINADVGLVAVALALSGLDASPAAALFDLRSSVPSVAPSGSSP